MHVSCSSGLGPLSQSLILVDPWVSVILTFFLTCQVRLT